MLSLEQLASDEQIKQEYRKNTGGNHGNHYIPLRRTNLPAYGAHRDILSGSRSVAGHCGHMFL